MNHSHEAPKDLKGERRRQKKQEEIEAPKVKQRTTGKYEKVK